MIVRKKVLTEIAAREKLGGPPELASVFRSIRSFNPEEHTMSDETEAPTKPRKKAKPKKVVKKVTKKETKQAPDNLVTLAELAEAAKVEPMTARRYLRNSDIKMGTDARWAWRKGSAAIGEVKKLLAGIGK